ncbi:MAG: hypothetical protein WCP33_02175 [Deltaproteobacteria bacterium]
MATKKRHSYEAKSRVDWGTAWIGWGFGIACMVMGGLVFWAASTSGAAGPSGNALRMSQRIVAVLPNNLKQKLALAVGVLMFLGGIFLFALGFYGVYKDISNSDKV